MRMKLGYGAAAASVFALALIGPSAVAAHAGGSHASPAITQPYSCDTPIGPVDLTGTVTGKATIKGTKISLKSVKYSVTNSTGFALTIDHVNVSTPDPSQTDAPYKDGSVKVSKKPKGWKAGHDSVGVFASFKGSQDIANGADVSVAATSAQYKSKGASGTVVDFKPGDVTFHVSAPIAGDVSCTPNPAGTFASVTE
jgi:hypothetical protein